MAIASRKRVLDMVAIDRLMIAGSHQPRLTRRLATQRDLLTPCR
jgi:hypothetical protein